LIGDDIIALRHREHHLPTIVAEWQQLSGFSLLSPKGTVVTSLFLHVTILRADQLSVYSSAGARDHNGG
jgi:hypothetical protein